jgi:pyridoxine kinase
MQGGFFIIMKKVLTIAGSDTSGGAGIQADLKTFQEREVYGMTALTTIVTMDPKNKWSHNVFPIDINTLKAQLSTTVEGIGINAMKTGMLGSVEIINLVAETIDKYNLKNIVIDPVMVCKGEDEVLHPETAESLRDTLTPRATVVTPNLFEAGQISGLGTPTTVEEMKAAAEKIHALGPQYELKVAESYSMIKQLTFYMMAKRSMCLKVSVLTHRIHMEQAVRTQLLSQLNLLKVKT